jgi:DNA-directed RNA polymerase alpha subunit
VTGLSARPARKLITRPAEQAAAAPVAMQVPVSRRIDPRPQAEPAAAESQDPQAFFRALRAAGINVRIAQALHAAGFRSAAQVRACSDTQLLATPGVGQATLRKLRIQFGLPQTTESAQSDAA